MKKETKDYNQFKLLSTNRYIKEFHVRALMASIKENNLLEMEPIKVNTQFEVIDGQHRLEAAKRLGIPIWYEMDKNLKEEHITFLNDTKLSWNNEDYLNRYCELGYPEYIKLREMLKKYNLGLSSLRILSGGGNKSRSDFKRGKFVMRKDLASDEMMDNIREIQDYMFEKYSNANNFQKKFLQNYNVWLCLLRMLEGGMDKNMFKQKFLMNADDVRPCTSFYNYLRMFTKIYNWKNREPLNMSHYDDEKGI